MDARLMTVTNDFWTELNTDFFQNVFICLFALQTFLQGNLFFKQ
jgi:hypothetical protein